MSDASGSVVAAPYPALSARLAAAVRPQRFIINARQDAVFFFGSPLIGLALAWFFFRVDSPYALSSWVGEHKAGLLVFIITQTIVRSHLVLVFSRSHLNPKIFKLHPYRFALAPVLIFLPLLLSETALAWAFCLSNFWDIYHSGMQTFGLGRMYDARAGSDPVQGRLLDIGLNQIVYVGAILSGINFMPQLEQCLKFQGGHFGLWFLMRPALPAMAARLHDWVLAAGAVFLVAYLLRYWRLARQGYRVSWQKVALYSVTGIVSIYAWSALPFAVALFVVNFYHACQYYAVVWWAEKGNLRRLFGDAERPSLAPLLVMVALAVFYGLIPALGGTGRLLFAAGVVVSLLHFWYDGFIWSVRKKQV